MTPNRPGSIVRTDAPELIDRSARATGRALVAALTVSAAGFLTYPLLRPWGSEAWPDGASTFGSSAWAVAHSLGMIAFVALAFGLRAAAHTSPAPWQGRSVRILETLGWLSVALLLPYYGAEAFALNAAGRQAQALADPAILTVADAFRYAPLPITAFGLGLLALAAVGVGLARLLWRAGGLARIGGLLTGIGLATYLPQFYLPAAGRIGHGIVLAAGLALVALATWRSRSSRSADVTPRGA